MFERKLHSARLIALLVGLLPATVYSVEVGFEGLVFLEASDNVETVNNPDEEEGTTAGVVLGAFGEHRSRIVKAGFSGEIDTRRIISDEDDSLDTITSFLGAAEFNLTPRSWRWYIGDILGGVRTDNAIQTFDENDLVRRNVFVTGPSFEYDVVGVSRTRARLLYVNQTEEDEELETLYTANFSHERETTPGSYFGFSLGNIFTDFSEGSDLVSDTQDPDFNRSTASVFWNRLSGFVELFGRMGITRIDTDEESLNGLNAELRAIRRLGPLTSFTVALTRDLNDQTLSTIESLIESGTDAIGVTPEAPGFFSETRLSLGYSFQSSQVTADINAGVAQQDYQLLTTDSGVGLSANGEDQVQVFASGSLSRRLSNRLLGQFAISYERQDFDNRVDETDSVLASAQLIYSLSTSFDLEASVIHDTSQGVLTRFGGTVGVAEDVDITENRVTIGVRWAPPTRASQDLTVELKSLLQ